MGDNSEVYLLSVWVGGVLAAHGGGNCLSLLPLSSGSLRKKDLRGGRKLQKEIYVEDQEWS